MIYHHVFTALSDVHSLLADPVSASRVITYCHMTLFARLLAITQETISFVSTIVRPGWKTSVN